MLVLWVSSDSAYKQWVSFWLQHRWNYWMNTQHIATPQAGKDYLRNWNEFLDWFGSEEAFQA